MDDLIALAEALEKKAFRGPTMEAVHLKTVEWKAAAALRASAEREKEMVEALDNFADMISEGVDDLPDDECVTVRVGQRLIDYSLTLGDLRKFAKLALARAILDKHKECP